MATSTSVPRLSQGPNAALAPVSANYNGRLAPSSLNGLDLTNGMTAGYGVRDGHTKNPPAFAGSYGGNQKEWPTRRVGMMRNVPNTGAPGNYALYFIFNPNDISVSFDINTSAIPSNYKLGLGGSSSGPGFSQIVAPALNNSQAVAWTLLFDRTYDMLYGPKSGDQRGVLADTSALYNLLGTFATDGAVPVSYPVQVVFGQNDAGQLWGFTGFIASVSIDYGIMRYDMMPSRCEVQLAMQATYVSASISATDPTSGKTGGANWRANLMPKGVVPRAGHQLLQHGSIAGPPINGPQGGGTSHLGKQTVGR